MATIYGSKVKGWQAKIEYSYKQDISKNTSTITAKLYVYTGSADSWNGYDNSAYYTIQGIKKYQKYDFRGDGVAWQYIGSRTFTQAHKSDGSCKITLSGKWHSGNETSYTPADLTVSETVTLKTIPRATKPKLSKTQVEMGDSLTCDLTSRASSDFTHTVSIRPEATGVWKKIADKTTSTKVTIQVPDFASELPSDISGDVKVQVTTYNGSDRVGEHFVTFVATVPTRYVPSFTMSTKEANLTGYTGLIQGHSAITATITAKGAAGSSVKSVSAVFCGKKYSGSSWTSDTIKSSGSLSIQVTVEDSRGRRYTRTEKIQVHAYRPPAIKSWRVDRCNADQQLDSAGEYAKLSWEYSISCVDQGVTGRGEMEEKEKSEPESQYAHVNETTQVTGTYYTKGALFTSVKSYDVRLTVEDSLGGVATLTKVLRTEEVILDIRADGSGIAIGKISEKSKTAEFGWGIDMYNNPIINQG